MIVARLRARGVDLGYVSLFRTGHARPPYDLEDLHLVRDLADRAALAIDNSRLLDGLERRVAERTSEDGRRTRGRRIADGEVDLLRQVWINLLDNAVKYSQRRPIARIVVAGTREAGENRYTVTDNGTGFDQYADKLFGVFQRPASVSRSCGAS